MRRRHLIPGIEMSTELDQIAERIRTCVKCPLHEGRMHAVPGEGHPHAQIVLVGEAPGGEEDRTGRPFVGRAGALLSDILGQLGIRREDLFITNVVKCRPPANRTPSRTELRACQPYIASQLQVIRPRMVVLLGKTALSSFFTMNDSPLRGAVVQRSGISYLWTYHPAACLRNPEYLPLLKIHLKRAVDFVKTLRAKSERVDLDSFL